MLANNSDLKVWFECGRESHAYAAFNYFMRPVGRYTYLEIAGHCKDLVMAQTADGERSFHGVYMHAVHVFRLGKVVYMVVQQTPTGSPLLALLIY